VTIRLYLDDDSSAKALVKALRERGVDVVTTMEVGLDGRDDEEHLAYAPVQSRVLCSFNIQDFYRIHSQWLSEGKSHAGIILAQQQKHREVGERLRRILNLAASKSAEDMKNSVEFLSRWG